MVAPVNLLRVKWLGLNSGVSIFEWMIVWSGSVIVMIFYQEQLEHIDEEKANTFTLLEERDTSSNLQEKMSLHLRRSQAYLFLEK